MAVVKVMTQTKDQIASCMTIAVVGESGSGKSSVILTAKTGKVSLVKKYTVGSEISFVKTPFIDPVTKEETIYNISILGFGGQKVYLKNIKRSRRIREVQACLLCFDLNDRASFDSIPVYVKILAEKWKHRTALPPPVILTGLKDDLEWAVEKKRIVKFMQECKELNIVDFVVCSVRDFKFIYEPFKAALANHLNVSYDPPEPIYHGSSFVESLSESSNTVDYPCPHCDRIHRITFTAVERRTAKERLSGLAEKSILCPGPDDLDPATFRVRYDEHGEIRGDKDITPAYDTLTTDQRNKIILKVMVAPHKLDTKKAFDEYWKNILEGLHDRLQNRIPALNERLTSQTEKQKIWEKAYKILNGESLWKKFVVKPLDRRVTKEEVARCFMWFWLIDKKAITTKEDIAMYKSIVERIDVNRS